jgi:hypothetical protein
MIITDDFVFIHNARSGGTYLNDFILNHLGGVQLGYHIPCDRIPLSHRGKPVIMSVRNPWDWYVSYYFLHMNYYRSVISYLVSKETLKGGGLFIDIWKEILDSTRGITDTKAPLARYTNPEYRGDNVTQEEVAKYISEYKGSKGLYSWNIDRMLKGCDNAFLCKMEELPTEFLRVLETIGVKVPEAALAHLTSGGLQHSFTSKKSGKYTRDPDYTKYYSPYLAHLVSLRDSKYIEELQYTFLSSS